MIACTPRPPAADNLSAIPWVRDARSAWARYKWRGISFFLVTMAAVTAFIVLYPSTYASEAKLIVRVGRESVTLDPTATSAAGETINLNDSRETEVNSVLDVLESRVMLQRVVDELGPAVILPHAAGTPLDHELAVRDLEHSMKMTHTKKSNVITVQCKARTPELAQKIVAVFLDVFHIQHIRINRTAGSHEFFVRQSDLLNEQLTRAMKELSDAKNKLGLVSVDGQRKLIQDQIASIENSRLTTEASLASAQASVETQRKALAAIPERQTTEEVTGFPNGAVDMARQQLNQFRIREQELLTRYTAEHPLVLATRQQADEAKKILAMHESKAAQTTSSTNPTHQDLSLKLLDEEANAASLQAQSKLLQEQFARLQEQLRALNDQEGNLSLLQHRVDLLETNHRTYAEKLEQARIDQALEQELISNVNVVQPPTLVTKPVSPKRGLVLAAGLIVATLGGIGIIFLSEQLGRAALNANLSRLAYVPALSR